MARHQRKDVGKKARAAKQTEWNWLQSSPVECWFATPLSLPAEMWANVFEKCVECDGEENLNLYEQYLSLKSVCKTLKLLTSYKWPRTDKLFYDAFRLNPHVQMVSWKRDYKEGPEGCGKRVDTVKGSNTPGAPADIRMDVEARCDWGSGSYDEFIQIPCHYRVLWMVKMASFLKIQNPSWTATWKDLVCHSNQQFFNLLDLFFDEADTKTVRMPWGRDEQFGALFLSLQKFAKSNQLLLETTVVVGKSRYRGGALFSEHVVFPVNQNCWSVPDKNNNNAQEN